MTKSIVSVEITSQGIAMMIKFQFQLIFTVSTDGHFLLWSWMLFYSELTPKLFAFLWDFFTT